MRGLERKKRNFPRQAGPWVISGAKSLEWFRAKPVTSQALACVWVTLEGSQELAPVASIPPAPHPPPRTGLRAWFTHSWLGNLDRLHYRSVPSRSLLHNGNNNAVTSSANLLAPLLRTMFIKWQLKSAVRVPTANFLNHRCPKTHSWKKATHFLPPAPLLLSK